jgi:hypothetical protein
MNFVLTIDSQPLVLKLEAILALFGNPRTMEFAEGKWTPFVSFALQEQPGPVPEIHRIEFSDMSESEMKQAMSSLPKDISDFAGFVRDEIAKIENKGA